MRRIQYVLMRLTENFRRIFLDNFAFHGYTKESEEQLRIIFFIVCGCSFVVGHLKMHCADFRCAGYGIRRFLK